MVYKYKPKGKRGQWTEDQMKLAMAESRRTSISSASKKYHIPLGTLHRHIKKKSSTKKLGRFKTVFSEEMESQIVEHAKLLDSRYFGLTRNALKELAYQLAEKNNISHPFRKKAAGRYWVEGFMSRHSELSFRSPETTSIARCAGFNKRKVGEFFDNLEAVYGKHNFLNRPSDIYNMDETGVCTSAGKPPKLISVKGKKQVGVISTAERGELTTVMVCCNAAGSFIPPCFIFGKRKRVGERMLDGGPAGCVGFCSDSGWVNSDIFVDWLHFFIKQVRSSKDQQVLLILDNHNSHLNLKAINLARENGVVMLSVPPHTTHKLQPLDVAIFKSFKSAFENSIDTFQKNHPGRRINQLDLPELVKSAFEMSATIRNATNGFRKCGIYPYNKYIFTDADFAPSQPYFIEDKSPSDSTIRNIETRTPEAAPLLQNFTAQTDPSTQIRKTDGDPSTQVSTAGQSERSTKPGGNPNISPQPGSSKMIYSPSRKKLGQIRESFLKQGSSDSEEENQSYFSPADILPIPKVENKVENKRKSRCQKSEIITSTPFKLSLLERQQKQTTKGKKKDTKVGKKTQNKKGEKLKLIIPKPPKEKLDPENDIPCLICQEPFSNSKSKEIWVQCNICQNWAHKLCTNFEGGVFICDFCRNDVVSHLKY